MERTAAFRIKNCVRRQFLDSYLLSRRGIAMTTSSITSTPRSSISRPQSASLNTSSRPSSNFIRTYSSSSASTTSPPTGTIRSGAAGSTSASAFNTSSASPSAAPTLSSPAHLDPMETEIWQLLQEELAPTELEVKDVSGGCGSMYAIDVTSERFRGLGMLAQQRLVNRVLGERVKGWHGVQLRTKAP